MFFQNMFDMMTTGVDINLTLRKKEGQLTVAVLPRVNGLKDEAQQNLVPITVTGSPGELDAEFLTQLALPMQKTSGILFNIKAFEEQSLAVQSNSKAEKDRKDKEAKEQKDRKTKFEQLFKQGEEAEKQRNYKQALDYYQQAKNFAPNSSLKAIDAKIESMKSWNKQGCLFDMTSLEKTLKEEKVAQVPETVLKDSSMKTGTILPGEDFGENILAFPKSNANQNQEDYAEYIDFPDFNSAYPINF